MKKRMIMALTLMCMMLLAACGKTSTGGDTSAPQKEETTQVDATTETQKDTLESLPADSEDAKTEWCEAVSDEDYERLDREEG